MRPRKGRRRLLQPIVQFIQTEASSGLLLIAVAVIALLWANSPWSGTYFHLWETPIRVGLGEREISKTAHHWINDGLMAVFFLLVGLEIKREILLGELSSRRLAALPVAAALGGMVVPAAIYAAFNAGGPGAPGWGVPMATDIAFALGVLAVLGPRVPLGLKVFLAALAIVDDLGAVLVIALFYSDSLDGGNLLLALGLVAFLGLLNVAGVRKLTPYLVGGVLLWLAVLGSGVHATIAGVLLAATIPARVRLNTREYAERVREAVDQFEEAEEGGENVVLSQPRQTLIEEVASVSEDVQMPLERLEGSLHPWVTFGIMPLFALANAGVPLGEGVRYAATDPVAHGTIAGLLIGKPVGVFALSKLAVGLKLAELPTGVRWRHVFGVGVLAGIGFTMSLFIADLGLPADHIVAAKTAILGSSVVAGIAGYLILRRVSRARPTPHPQESG